MRWLWGAFEALRTVVLAWVPPDAAQQVDTSALPVKHPSRVRGPDQWQDATGLAARFGWDAAHREWFYGFRLGLRTDLGSRLIHAWTLTRAAVDERAVADDLLDGSPPPAALLVDRGFVGRTWEARQAERGTHVLFAASHAERQAGAPAARGPVAVLRNRIETTLGELTAPEQLGLARHGAHTFWGLLTRCAATILAHTLLRLGLTRRLCRLS